jgi:outer membrane murein-binding lipoprotein Lpp
MGVRVRRYWIAGVVVAALGLSACGTAATSDTINSAVSSLSSSQYLQVHFTATASGAGSAEAQPYLKLLSFDVNYVNPTGAAISQATTPNAEMTFNVGSQALLDLREINGVAYVEINVPALSSIPSANIPASDLAAAQLLIGGRWFELTKGFVKTELKSLVPTSTTLSPAQESKDQATSKKLISALTNLIDTGNSTALANGNGYSETGSLASVVNALYPTLTSIDPTMSKPADVKGTYDLTLTTSGSTATGGSLTITVPGSTGDQSVGLQATVTHNNDPIVTPTDATVVTPALIKGLLSEAK